MHSAKGHTGHTVVDERWRFELALADACCALAPRASECLAPALDSGKAPQSGDSYRAISYYSYRYL